MAAPHSPRVLMPAPQTRTFIWTLPPRPRGLSLPLPAPAASRSLRPLLPKPRLFWLLSLPQRALSLRPAASICSDVGAGLPEPGGPARATGWGEVPGGSALGGPACRSPARCGAGSAPRNPTGRPRARLCLGASEAADGGGRRPGSRCRRLSAASREAAVAARAPPHTRSRRASARSGPGTRPESPRPGQREHREPGAGRARLPAGEEAPRGRREKQEKERRPGGERVRPSRRGEARGRGWEAPSSRTTGRKDGAGAPRPPRGWGAAVRSRVGEEGVGRGASHSSPRPSGSSRPIDACAGAAPAAKIFLMSSRGLEQRDLPSRVDFPRQMFREEAASGPVGG